LSAAARSRWRATSAKRRGCLSPRSRAAWGARQQPLRLTSTARLRLTKDPAAHDRPPDSQASLVRLGSRAAPVSTLRSLPLRERSSRGATAVRPSQERDLGWDGACSTPRSGGRAFGPANVRGREVRLHHRAVWWQCTRCRCRSSGRRSSQPRSRTGSWIRSCASMPAASSRSRSISASICAPTRIAMFVNHSQTKNVMTAPSVP